MIKQPKLKLSELPDDIEVSAEYSGTTYTVAELKREIIEMNELHHETKGWHVISRQKWHPDAESMIDDYIERNADDLFEDAYESMRDPINEDRVARIQAIMDEAFPGGFDYWEYGKDVEIDIFPPERGDSQ